MLWHHTAMPLVYSGGICREMSSYVIAQTGIAAPGATVHFDERLRHR